MMPGMDGGAVAALLQANPVLAEIPMVFLTAVVSNKETGGHEALIGNMPFLAKPVDLQELIGCIERHARVENP